MISDKENFYDKYHIEDDLVDIIWDLGSRHTRRIIIDLIEVEQGRVLDVGAGLGILLSEIDGFEKYALEYSRRTIERGKNLYKDVNWVLGDAQEIPFYDGFFDLVISSHTLEHIKDDKKAIEEIYRILKVGGQLILYLPSNSKGILKKELEEVNGHYRTYTKDSVSTLLSGRFVIEKCLFPDRFLGFVWKYLRNFLVIANTMIKMIKNKRNFVYYFKKFILRQDLSGKCYGYEEYQYCHTAWYRKLALPFLEFTIYPVDRLFGRYSPNIIGFLNSYEQIVCVSAKKLS